MKLHLARAKGVGLGRVRSESVAGLRVPEPSVSAYRTQAVLRLLNEGANPQHSLLKINLSNPSIASTPVIPSKVVPKEYSTRI